MATLLLLRHGQIKANRQGRWHGSTDSPLTWRGRRQARRTARHILNVVPPVTAVYSSPLTRCLSTAEAIARRLALPVSIDEGLREYAIGEWEDTPFTELAGTHGFFEAATTDPDFAPPGGETLRQVTGRVTTAIRAIDAAHGSDERVLVVSHGVAIAVALGALLDDDPTRWVDYPLQNCSLTELVLSPMAYVNFFNFTQHL